MKKANRALQYRFGVFRYLGWFLLFAGLMAGFGYAYFRHWRGMVCMIPLSFLLMRELRRKRTMKLRDQILREFCDFISAMNAALKASNISPAVAFVTAVESLEGVYGNHSAFMRRAKEMVTRLRNNNRLRFEDELMSLAQDLREDDIVAFADAIRECCGINIGYISRVIERYCHLIEVKRRTLEETRTAVTESSREAMAMVFAPVAIVVLLNMTMPSLMTYMYTTMTGVLCMAFCCTANFLLYLMIARILRFETEGRI